MRARAHTHTHTQTHTQMPHRRSPSPTLMKEVQGVALQKADAMLVGHRHAMFFGRGGCTGGRPGRRRRRARARVCRTRVAGIGVCAVAARAGCGRDRFEASIAGICRAQHSGGLRSSSRRHARMLEEGVEGAGVQCVQRADTCSAMHWCALLSAGAWMAECALRHGVKVVRPQAVQLSFRATPPLQRRTSRPLPCCIRRGAKPRRCKTTSFRKIKGPPPPCLKVPMRVPPCDDVPSCPCLFLLPPPPPFHGCPCNVTAWFFSLPSPSYLLVRAGCSNKTRRRASPCKRLWALRMPTLLGIKTTKYKVHTHQTHANCFVTLE